MSQFMHQSSKVMFTHHLKNLSAMLKAAAADAKARGIDPPVILNARLAPDMFPLIRQVQIATDHAKGCCGRLAGVELPVFKDDETTFAQLQERIKRVQSFLKSLKASQFAGSEDRLIELTLPIGSIRFSGADYLNGWALPNFYFHYSATYNILRHNGLQLGKRDYLGIAPGMQMTGKIAKMMGGKATPKAKAKKKA